MEMVEMKKFKVISYSDTLNAHLCEEINQVETAPRNHWIDLMVNGDLTRMTPESIVGKEVEMEYYFTHISIGVGCKLIMNGGDV